MLTLPAGPGKAPGPGRTLRVSSRTAAVTRAFPDSDSLPGGLRASLPGRLR